jgi:DNA-binding response OmpR family regulator
MNQVILLIEDEDELRHILARTLHSEGYEVVEACDGHQAIAYLRDPHTPRPNMILLDLMLPGMNGWSLRAELLKDPLLARIPIVVLSGTANVPQTAASMRAAAYIEKPFRLDSFLHVIENHLPLIEAQILEDEALLQTMSDAVERLTGLIENILQRCTFHDDHLVATIRPFNLADLGESILDEIRPRAAARDIDLKLVCNGDLPVVYGDESLVSMIVRDLVTSAVEALEFGAVDLLCHFDGRHYRLGIRELGRHERYADPLFRSSESLAERSEVIRQRKSAPGVGLALSLVRELLASIEASIEVQSDPEGASIFTLVLPQGQPAEHASIQS